MERGNEAAAVTVDARVLRNTWLLSASHAIKMSQTGAIFAVAGLVGEKLATDPGLATLPIALQFVAIMVTTIPASWAIERFGARVSFLVGALLGILGVVVAAWSMLASSFAGFCVGIVLGGAFNAVSNYYRFVAADQSPSAFKSRAISYVLGGGVIAAFVGPNIARFSRGWLEGPEFFGSFVAVFFVSLLSLPALYLLKVDPVRITAKSSGGRSMTDIVRQPKFIIALVCGVGGWCVMNFLMVATPLSMKEHHHSFSDTASVLQWHVLAMFAPAFVTGRLIKRFGVAWVLLAGVLLEAACVVLNLAGTSLVHFSAALIVLGVGWNFVFIGATTLLTDTYRPEESGRAQALNDLAINTCVALSAFGSGAVHHRWGWVSANLAAIPWIAIMLVMLAWLKLGQSQASTHAVPGRAVLEGDN